MARDIVGGFDGYGSGGFARGDGHCAGKGVVVGAVVDRTGIVLDVVINGQGESGRSGAADGQQAQALDAVVDLRGGAGGGDDGDDGFGIRGDEDGDILGRCERAVKGADGEGVELARGVEGGGEVQRLPGGDQEWKTVLGDIIELEGSAGGGGINLELERVVIDVAQARGVVHELVVGNRERLRADGGGEGFHGSEGRGMIGGDADDEVVGSSCGEGGIGGLEGIGAGGVELDIAESRDTADGGDGERAAEHARVRVLMERMTSEGIGGDHVAELVLDLDGDGGRIGVVGGDVAGLLAKGDQLGGAAARATVKLWEVAEVNCPSVTLRV